MIKKQTIILVCYLLLTSLASSNYNEQIAAKMISVSVYAYKLESVYAAFQTDKIIETKDLLKGNDLRAVIGYDPAQEAIVVGFRGSDNVKNWIVDDARIRKVPYPQCIDCKIHVGFAQAYEKLQNQNLLPAIFEALSKHKSKQIIFTGHSLGGAIAHIAALKWKEGGYAKELTLQLYTFGQPRVGNKRFANYHSIQVQNNYRVVHNKDLVPHKPAFLIWYQHSGNEEWYFEEMAKIRKECPRESGQSALCSNQIGSFLHDYDGKDHFSSNYLKLATKYNL